MSYDDKLARVNEMRLVNDLIMQLQKRLFDVIHKQPIIFKADHYNNMFAHALETCERTYGSLSSILSSDHPENYFEFKNEEVTSTKVGLDNSPFLPLIKSSKSNDYNVLQLQGNRMTLNGEINPYSVSKNTDCNGLQLQGNRMTLNGEINPYSAGKGNDCNGLQSQGNHMAPIDEVNAYITSNDTDILRLQNPSTNFIHKRSQSDNTNIYNCNTNMGIQRRRSASTEDKYIIPLSDSSYESNDLNDSNYPNDSNDPNDSDDYRYNNYDSVSQSQSDKYKASSIQSDAEKMDGNGEFIEIVNKKKKKNKVKDTINVHSIEIRSVMLLKSLKDSELKECSQIKNIDSFDNIKFYARYIDNDQLVLYKYRHRYYIGSDNVLYDLERGGTKLVPGKFRGVPQTWVEKI